jgi:hypothetical protein
MATIANLYHVGKSLAKVLHTEIDAIVSINESSIQVGPPLDVPDGTADQIRISLMWVSEHASHRNDLPHRRLDGIEEPPPITVSAFYMISTYGTTAAGEASRAHELLGNVVQTFHARPEITLPVPGLAFGRGPLTVALVPSTQELMETVFAPLQTKHRPFVIYEVSPVQLVNLRQPARGHGVVVPGGIELGGPTPMTKPLVSRVVPSVQGRGGRIRIDGVWPSTQPDRIVVDGIEFAGAALTVLDAGRSLALTLPITGPNAIALGTHRIAAAVGRFDSEPIEIAIVAETLPTIDAPATRSHDRTVVLELAGRALDSVVEVFAWPDAGVRAPTDVERLTPSAITPTKITIPAAQLAALSTMAYRVAGRIATGGFTPYIAVDFT